MTKSSAIVSVAVEQDHGSALATRDVVDAKTIYLDEPAWGAGASLGLDGLQSLVGLPGNLLSPRRMAVRVA